MYTERYHREVNNQHQGASVIPRSPVRDRIAQSIYTMCIMWSCGHKPYLGRCLFDCSTVLSGPPAPWRWCQRVSWQLASAALTQTRDWLCEIQLQCTVCVCGGANVIGA